LVFSRKNTGSEIDTSLFTWDIVTSDGKPVKGFGGLPICPQKSMEKIENTDVILIPGILPPIYCIGNLEQNIKNQIFDWHKKDKLIGTFLQKQGF